MAYDPGELVLVVPNSILPAVGVNPGFHRIGSRKQIEKICDHANSFMRRDQCEDDPAYRQLIPYVVFRDAEKNIFTYKRSGKGEKRLSYRRSIGVGGHVNADDCKGKTGLAGFRLGMIREVEQEVVFERKLTDTHWIATIVDDSDSVGKVHLGIVALVDVRFGTIFPADGSEFKAHQMMDWTQLQKYMDEFESWSQLTIAGLFPSAESMRVKF